MQSAAQQSLEVAVLLSEDELESDDESDTLASFMRAECDVPKGLSSLSSACWPQANAMVANAPSAVESTPNWRGKREWCRMRGMVFNEDPHRRNDEIGQKNCARKRDTQAPRN